MSFELLDLKYWNWRLSQGYLIKIERGGIIDIQTEMKDGRAAGTGRASSLIAGNSKDSNRSLSHGNRRRSFPAGYFTVESFLLLLCLTASLLILPVILPPLPPPPFMLLLLPIAIFALLMILAFMPSDIRDIASSYV
ncbi:hypothetical protein NE237_014915 [Protea cynaroides]|uniref:ARGOS-like protein n=1 Tax=Protea cynaroides TaxID=273540 RepID=A0A9Q0KD63_9MAGN|nr:hypothetical protein NE237_014915 [Protea cynaroides]